MEGVTRELRCRRHLHGVIAGDVLTVKCGQCSRDEKRPIYHRFRLVGGTIERINDEAGAALDKPPGMATTEVAADAPQA
jgi:hypothetical protein